MICTCSCQPPFRRRPPGHHVPNSSTCPRELAGAEFREPNDQECPGRVCFQRVVPVPDDFVRGNSALDEDIRAEMAGARRCVHPPCLCAYTPAVIELSQSQANASRSFAPL
jgi:hypothetical protein